MLIDSLSLVFLANTDFSKLQCLRIISVLYRQTLIHILQSIEAILSIVIAKLHSERLKEAI